MSYELGTTASSGYSNPITISPAVCSSSGGFFNPSSEPAISSSSSGFFNPGSSSYRSSNEDEAVAGLIVVLCEVCCLCCEVCAKEENA